MLAENTHMKGILEVAKFDKGAQVEIISSSMNQKLSKFDKKLLAQHRKESIMRKKTIATFGKQKTTNLDQTNLLKSSSTAGPVGGRM